MRQVAHLYFHSPCFDGIASGVLALDFLESRQDWSFAELHPVNYDLKDIWLATKLNSNAAVVDYLYHPDAKFWADHHGTTFLSSEARTDFEHRRSSCLIYDRSIGSCALLLWDHLWSSFGHRNLRYESLVNWANRIDAAHYRSVEEAIFGTEPALRINSSLDGKVDLAYCIKLVNLLKHEPLDYVAAQPYVQARAAHTEELIRAGLERVVNGSTLEEDGLVVFDVDSTGVIVNRYAPYYVFPEARYSVGLVTSPNGAVIRAMRNPWREFPSIPLGQIFGKFGGGGHQRVGAVVFPEERAAEARPILDQIVSEIRKAEALDHDTESQLL